MDSHLNWLTICFKQTLSSKWRLSQHLRLLLFRPFQSKFLNPLSAIIRNTVQDLGPPYSTRSLLFPKLTERPGVPWEISIISPHHTFLAWRISLVAPTGSPPPFFGMPTNLGCHGLSTRPLTRHSPIVVDPLPLIYTCFARACEFHFMFNNYSFIFCLFIFQIAIDTAIFSWRYFWSCAARVPREPQ